MVNKIHYRWDFVGLSTDTKPTPEESPKVVNGSTYYESDTSKLFVFYKDTWYERKPLGGGGGGSSYTAGDGIEIENNTISVDTEVVQPKLTAGTNITIDANNVISAEGGSSVNVVQTTGTSTTDVMSQKAVTDTLFYNNDNNRIQIGYGTRAESSGTVAIGSSAVTQSGSGGTGAVAIGNLSKALQKESIAIGASATSNYKGSVALGSHSTATGVGVVAIDSSMSSYGYNNSNYRLLTGLYDGQSAHDAVTVEQVNATIDAINTALSTSIPHIGA